MAREKILIVEDEHIVALEIKSRLIELGFEVCAHYASGEEAIQNIPNLQPDLVLLDIMLAGNIDGIQTGELIKEKYNIPFIFLTAYTDENTLRRAMAAGPYSYLHKPYEGFELQTSIQIALSKGKLEKELLERENLLSTTLGSISDTVFSIDSDLKILFMNRQGELFTDYSIEQYRNKPVNEILNIEIQERDDIISLNESNGLLINRKQPVYGKCVVSAARGELRTVDYVSSPMFDKENISKGYVITLKDITEKILAEEKISQTEEKIITISNNAQVALYNYRNETKEYEYISEVIEELTGYNVDEFKQLHFPSIIQKYEISKPLNMKNSLVMKHDWYQGKNEEFQADLLIITKTGEYRWLNDISKPWKNNSGKIIGTVGILRDVTEKKLDEQNLLRQYSELRTINEFISSMNKSPDYHEITHSSSKAIKELVQCDYIFFKIGDYTDYSEISRKKSILPIFDEIIKFSPWEKNTGDFSPKLYYNIIHGELPQNLKQQLIDNNIKSLLIFPLYSETNLFGCISLFFEIRLHLTEDEIHKLNLVISQINHSVRRNLILEELKRSELRYRNIFSLAPVGIYQSTFDGQIVTANDTFIKIMGYDSLTDILKAKMQHFYSDPNERQRLLDEYVHLGSAVELELKWKKKNNELIYVQLTSHAVKKNDGNFLYFEGFIKDITERKKAEEKLIQSEKEYKGLFENAHDAIIIFKPEKEIILDVNKRACEIYGLSHDEFIGTSLIDLSYDPVRGNKQVLQTLEKGSQHNFETRQFTKDGKDIYFEVNASLVVYKGQQAILSINHDITTRKKAEEELKKYQYHLEELVAQRTKALSESEEQFRALAQNIDDVIFRIDSNNIILFANPAANNFVEENDFTLIGNSLKEIGFHGDAYSELFETIKRVFLDGTKLRIELKVDDNSWLDCNVIPEFFGSKIVKSVLISARDISDNKISEQLLLRRDILLQAVADSSMVLISEENYEKAVDRAIALVGKSSQFSRVYIFNYTQNDSGDEFINLKFEWVNRNVGARLFNPRLQNLDFKKHKLTRFITELRTGKTVFGDIDEYNADEFNVLKGQNIRSFVLAPIFSDEKFWGFIGFEDLVLDRHWTKSEIAVFITFANNLGGAIKRWQVEYEIKLSRERWQNLFQSAPEPFYLINHDYIVIDCNNAAEKLIDTKRTKIIGKKITSTKLFPERYSDILRQRIQKCTAGQPSDPFEVEIEKTDYLNKIVEIRVFQLSISENTMILLSAHDISLGKKAESEIKNALQKANELNELKSRFVSMVSHEFRTPLATILSSVELMDILNESLSVDEKRDHFAKIIKSIDYMTDMLNDVITINRVDSGKLVVKLTNIEIIQFIKLLIEDVTLLAGVTGRVLFKQNIDQLFIYTDEKLLRQILNNLISNAIKYSPKKGEIICNVEKVEETVEIKIIDSGIGIPQNEIKDIFSPFHRAANIENIPGTGLGLAITKRSVDTLGGSILVQSKLGKGSVFTVILPINGAHN